LGRNLSFFLLSIFLIYVSGCSPAKNYKALSFFFDGVPNPEQIKAVQKADSISRQDSASVAQSIGLSAPPPMIYHPPYQEKECATCHDQTSMGKLTEPQPALCYECHEDFSKKYKVLHGPVDGGQCTECHSPHMAENKNLLTRSDQAICLYCHESEDVKKIESHDDIKNLNCIECHNPHGGDDKTLLR